jgi:purine-nucleoside phosphorylase
MPDFLTLEQIDTTADLIRQKTSVKPVIGIILGSGLGALADAVEGPKFIPYQDLPGWPVSTVQGHLGRLVAGKLNEHPVIVMQGRAHYYEGYPMQQVGFPVRVLQRLGVQILIVTNAAGGVNPDYEPGNLMLITDHLNLIGMAGLNPLRGPNLEEFGPRFPDMSQAYDRNLIQIARQAASHANVVMYEGVYACLAGPSFETPADLRFLRAAGVDAVGMSTVPEVTVARHGGMRVLGISGISNKANLDGNTATTHEEVLAAGKLIAPRLVGVIHEVLTRIPRI